jgi:carbon storage regulator
MLVVTRKTDEEIVIERGIRIKVLDIQGARVRIGVQAPESVRVDREEVNNLRAQFAARPAKSGRVPVCDCGAAGKLPHKSR